MALTGQNKFSLNNFVTSGANFHYHGERGSLSSYTSSLLNTPWMLFPDPVSRLWTEQHCVWIYLIL
jgi:hypothetical protein